jgi:hypothetical protein
MAQRFRVDLGLNMHPEMWAHVSNFYDKSILLCISKPKISQVMLVLSYPCPIIFEL